MEDFYFLASLLQRRPVIANILAYNKVEFIMLRAEVVYRYICYICTDKLTRSFWKEKSIKYM